MYDAWFVPDCTWKKNVLGQGLARKPERSAFLHDSRGAVAVGYRVVAWWFVDLILFGVLIGEDIFLQWKWLKCNCAPFFRWISDQKSLSARTSGACFTLLIHLQSSKMWTTPFSSTAGCLRRECFLFLAHWIHWVKRLGLKIKHNYFDWGTLNARVQQCCVWSFFFPWNDLAVLLSLVLIVNVPICMYVIYRKIHHRCTCRISTCSCHLLYLHKGGILIISGLAWYRDRKSVV